MPRKLTVECTCDRCGRIWYEDYSEGDKLPEAHALAVMLTGPNMAKNAHIRKVTFDALCKHCFQTVVGYIDKLDTLQKNSPAKAGAKEKPVPEDRPSKKAKPRKSSAGASAS